MPGNPASHPSRIALIAILIATAIFTYVSALSWTAHPIALGFRSVPAEPFPYDISARSDNGNNAKPNWLGHPASYLKGKFSTLDAKGKAVVTGNKLLVALKAPLTAFRSSQSKWTDVKAIEPNNQFGWVWSVMPYHNPDDHSRDDHDDPDEEITDWGLNDAFTNLSISTKATDWYDVNVHHSKEGKPPKGKKGATYPATGGAYLSQYCPSSRTLIASGSLSPLSAGKKKGLKEGQIPPLHKQADLVYLALLEFIKQEKKGNIKEIEHVFLRPGDEDDQDKKIFAMVTGTSDLGSYDAEWPGYDYPIGTDQASAALSSKDAQSMAELFDTHKKGMGVRTMDRAHLFECTSGAGDADMCMYMHFVDAKKSKSVKQGKRLFT